MSDIETAEKFVRSIGIWSRPFDSIVQVIADHDAAIRRQVVEEVLGKVEAIARVLHYPAAEIIAGEVRSEYAPQEKDVNTNQTATETSSARDAEVARRARVETFKELFAIEFKNPFHEHEPRLMTVLDRIREQAMLIAARHGIQPHEIEPRKVYTEADIGVAQDRFENWIVQCGPWYAHPHGETFKWSKEQYSYGSNCIVIAIAAHLRATKNFPEVK